MRLILSLLFYFLTWEKDPCHTMTVVWLTGTDASPNHVYWQEKESESDQWKETLAKRSYHQFGEKKWQVHQATITSLEADKLYRFSIGKRGEKHLFKTAPENLDDPVRFVVGGDVYHDTLEPLTKMFRVIKKTDPLFVVVAGDIAYAYPSKHSKTALTHRWFDFLTAWQEEMVTTKGVTIPLLPAIGNHDVEGGFGATPDKAPFFYSVFPFPGKPGYNVLDFSEYMSLIFLDSGHTNTVDGAQKTWLYKTVKSIKNFPYQFAIQHVSSYPSYRPYNGTKQAFLRKHWSEAFEQNPLTAVFEHHDHTLKRTKLIKNEKIDPDGVLYLGDGSMGIERPRNVNIQGAKWYLETSKSAQAVWLVTLRKSKASFEAISSQGVQLDFTERSPIKKSR